MYYLLTQREQLPRFFPKGGVGAEIGVAHGDYSAVILADADPSELHLIDPWSHLETGSDPLQATGFLADLEKEGVVFGAPPPNLEGDED